MPNKTIYVKEADLPLWDKAQTELGESVSALIADYLRRRLEELDRSKQPEAGRIEKIRLRFPGNTFDPNIIVKSFMGEWIVGSDDYPIEVGDSLQYAVARTAKGKLVVWAQSEQDHRPEVGKWAVPWMQVYENFEDLKVASDDRPRLPEDLIAETAAALGIDHEIELDI